MPKDDDDRETPLQVPRRRAWHSGTQRDIPGAEAARKRAQSQAEIIERAYAKDQVSDLADAVAEEYDEKDSIERESWEDIDTNVSAEQMKEIKEDPLLYKLFAKLMHERTTRGNAIIEALGKKPPSAQLATIRRRVNIIWALLLAAVTLAGGSVISVAKWWRASGVEQGTHEYKHQSLEDHQLDHEKRIRTLEEDFRGVAQRLDDVLWRSRTGVLTPPSSAQTLEP